MLKYKQADDRLLWKLQNQQPMLEDTWSPDPPFWGKESPGETSWYLSSPVLTTSSDGDSIMFLGRFFQWLIVLIITKAPKNQN